ncbi:unnamed protein product [Clavelina lepadiformis]|uniref:Uncharacterized protein n=1 Tax=Clavelina lepadiformis TaxID=159417 RepID=A0ABP0FCR3_CLALP
MEPTCVSGWKKKNITKMNSIHGTRVRLRWPVYTLGVEGNVASSSRKYENIEGAYQNVISAPQANAQPHNQGNVASSSRKYKNVEGCSDEVISASRSNNMELHSRAHPDSNRK